MELLNEHQVAEQLQVSKSTLRVWRWKGIGPHYAKIGRCVRYRQTDIYDFINSKIKNTDYV